MTQRSLFHTLRHIVRVTTRNTVATVPPREIANDHHLAVLAATSWTMSPWTAAGSAVAMALTGKSEGRQDDEEEVQQAAQGVRRRILKSIATRRRGRRAG